jgi:type I restriction enzyme, S subunit
MKKYTTLKPSGIDLLGDIPEGWEIMRLRFLISIRKGKKPEENTESFGGLPYLTMGYLRGQEKPTNYIPSKESVVINDGDILLLWDGANAGEFVKSSNGILSSTMAKLSFGNYNQNYYFYFLKSFEKDLKGLTIGMGIPHVNINILKNCATLLPSASEQSSIADFLDLMTMKIDELVLKKQKLIDFLKEEHTAIINEAVTQGIKQKVQYRKSKLDCLSIPEHWKEIRAKNVFFESQDKAKGDEELLSVSHYTGVTPRSEKNVYMFLAESYEGYKLCKKDDLVINTMWAWMGALGISEYDGIVSSGYGVYRFKNKNTFIPMYLNYLLRTPGYVGEYIKRSKGIHSSRWRLYPDEFFQITIICPPIEEQMDIVVYIQRETHKIDQSVARLGKEIDLLKEYRTALISEVVTGKLDVRQEVVS